MATAEAEARACVVPLGGRGGQPCGQQALHRIPIPKSGRTTTDRSYYVCCDHAPGPRHTITAHIQEDHQP